MTLETLVESDKGSFYNQREWLEEYEYGKGFFYSEYDDDKNYTSSEDNDSDWEEISSEDEENTDSTTEELPVKDKNIVVSVSILERLLFNGVQVLSWISKSDWRSAIFCWVSKKVENTMHQHKLSA